MTFIPPADGRQSTLVVELAPGASLDNSAAVAEEARRRIADIPEIQSVFVTAGISGGDGGPGDADR